MLVLGLGACGGGKDAPADPGEALERIQLAAVYECVLCSDRGFGVSQCGSGVWQGDGEEVGKDRRLTCS